MAAFILFITPVTLHHWSSSTVFIH